ncbi:MAG: hypothetical protein ACYC7D_04315 [Nitrososphaerales archaeon]
MIAKRVLVLSSFLVLFITFAMASPIAVSGQGSSGYVAYSITATNSTRTISANVNETITPSTTGLSTLSLQLISSMSNFSYSRLVNSSQALFPYLPVTGNQSFSYQYHNYFISASITQTGTGSATISGATYPTTEYTFSVSVSKLNGSQMSASGQLSTFPSGLVNSITASSNGYTINIQLLETNLALNSTSSSPDTTTMAIVGGTGTLAAGVGAFAFFRRKKESVNANEEKPLYHVD